ncbi:MAG: polysulfide reductase NrfD [Flavobacteriia bacterium]|nr:polysulfide reductase NrfD [Flavobacteriia bacterium]OIP45693.1 MAG: polysulfide reductase [Flavobacteriaceae bacterium CG2_30_31_66]PIV97129.1 MAG: polysulfide reductase [Flavobacteriaceae bacterium CG17_big_fil_post_rev_8_21_14_2_50_31_13]PIX11433.1 MAG: polysulfide reductase [Flavobacteriaceae bacterium CG_4_8_14_3_um_filter_31_8]PIY14848.1 MAG: polysulfide reductase [Flavobacteriaceae bacterium CG_4_10_14_3_um_filter_31_253]PIZ09575.1 MAG: polysulfide reductase [Flavobacteriaceae bacter
MKKTRNLIIEELAPKKFGFLGQVWVAFLCLVIVAALFAYYQQVTKGLVVTGMRDYALWGVYISNFVFFVAISLVGSLVTAVLRLSGAQWSTPLTRISEVIAVAAIIMGGLTIIIDMGRPDRILHIFMYGRLQSPIIWDVLVISTYLMISVLLLYFPLLPDFAILKKHFSDRPKLSNWYGKLSLKWKGNAKQKNIYNKSIRTLSVLIIPVAFGIHTVTAWLFATTYRPGWDSTNFGPYFIAGAFVAGTGAVVTIMYILQKAYKLEDYITDKHFDNMGKLLVMLCLVYLYFNVNEYLVPAYKTTKEEAGHLSDLFTGHYSTMFWSAIIFGLIVPVVVLIFRKGRKPLPLFIMGLFVVVGAWWKRYIIVTPTLLEPFVPLEGTPESWHEYWPTTIEWMITFGTLASALLIMTILFRYLPIIPIQETIEENE